MSTTLRLWLAGLFCLGLTTISYADTTADQQAAAEALAALTHQATASTPPTVTQALAQANPAAVPAEPAAVATQRAVPNGALDKKKEASASPVSRVLDTTTQHIKALGNTLSQPFSVATKPTVNKIATDNGNVEHVVWDKTPIAVTLSVDQERLINFPNDVRFGYDASTLNKDTLNVQNNAGTLYLVAKQPFSTQRVVVKDLSSGNMILLDLQAVKETGNTTPLSIVFDTTNKSTLTNTIANDDNSDTYDNEENGFFNYVTLTRFAAQQLYAPKRLLQTPAGIERVPLNTHKTVRLLRYDQVITMPLISWHGGHYYVTAVLVRNRLTQSVNLDPRLLLGNWKTATFQRNTLEATGSTNDSSFLYLISVRPFSESLASIRGDL